MKHTPSGKSAFENRKYFPKKDDGKRIRGFSTTYKRIE
jgi:DNA (cytosine-5)-methyltransferase 1